MALLKTISTFSILWCLKSSSFQLLLFAISAFWSCAENRSRSEWDLLTTVKNLTKSSFAEIFVRQFNFSPVVLFARDDFIACSDVCTLLQLSPAREPGGGSSRLSWRMLCVWLPLFSVALLLRRITSSTQVCAPGDEKQGKWLSRLKPTI